MNIAVMPSGYMFGLLVGIFLKIIFYLVLALAQKLFMMLMEFIWMPNIVHWELIV